MYKYLQVKKINASGIDPEFHVNQFLKTIGSETVSVTPLYHPVQGLIYYVVVYWVIITD